jgi:undecaprenyl-diphosphatase
MTIGANLSLSMKREFAVKFAFLMSIPVILGGFLLETYQLVSGTAAPLNPVPVVTGMIAAGVAGYFAIRFFIKTVMKGNLKWFAVYVFAVAALVFTDQLFFGLVFEKIF